MKIDYIRVYQDPIDSTHTIGCSPKAYPTAGFIEGNPAIFADWKPGGSPSLYGCSKSIEIRVMMILTFHLKSDTSIIYLI
jgi:hypothetical protein